MLTLERKEGETILIQHDDEELRIKVHHAKDDKIKLNFAGPFRTIWVTRIFSTRLGIPS